MNDKEDSIKERIVVLPGICHGKPTVKNTRHMVQSLVELLASGMSHEEILADFAELEEEDLVACLLFAARLTQVKDVTRSVA